MKSFAAHKRLCRAKESLWGARDRQTVGLGAETGSEGFISGSEGFEAYLDGLQTGFKELKAGYMGSVTWPEHQGRH